MKKAIIDSFMYVLILAAIQIVTPRMNASVHAMKIWFFCCCA